MALSSTAKKTSSLSPLSFLKMSALVCGVLLLIFYILSYLFDPQFLSDTFSQAGVLFMASPTIPILFLFSLLIPQAVACFLQKDGRSPIFLSLITSLLVLVSASLLGDFSGSEIVKQLAFYIVPSVLAAGSTFLYYRYLYPQLKGTAMLALLTAALVTPFTGLRVVLLYYSQSTNYGAKALFDQNSSGPASFTLLDVYLLSFSLIVVLLTIYSKFRYVGLLLNACFVILLLIWMYTMLK